jgi:hypothetical protein
MMEWRSIVLRTVSVLTAVVLIILFWASIRGWMNKNGAMAAWVQAGGIFVALYLSGEMARRQDQRREQRRRAETENVATMRIAARLRPWLRLAADAVTANQQFEDSGGVSGKLDLSVPPFEIELDVAALLSVDHAKHIYSLIELRARSFDEIAGTNSHGDPAEARQQYYLAMAVLFDRVRSLYRTFARNTGLHELVPQPWELQAMARARSNGNPVAETAAG